MALDIFPSEKKPGAYAVRFIPTERPETSIFDFEKLEDLKHHDDPEYNEDFDMPSEKANPFGYGFWTAKGYGATDEQAEEIGRRCEEVCNLTGSPFEERIIKQRVVLYKYADEFKRDSRFQEEE